MKTSVTGGISLVCPEGRLHIEARKVVDGNEVKLIQESSINHPNPINNKPEMDQTKPIRLIVNQHSKKVFHEILYSHSAAFVGDCSGSMSSNNNIEKLKRSFLDVWEAAKKDGFETKIAFTSWNTQSYFCKKSWLVLSDEYKVKNWISNLRAEGGTDMQTGIMGAINTFSPVENIITI
ncbi:unnamed protein product, partial [Rotaria sp. Silwood2]